MWVTVFGRVNHLGAEPGTRAYSARVCFLLGWNEYLAKAVGNKQAYRVTHQPVCVVSQCSLIAWLNELARRNQRRLTGSGSALEACSRRCAVQMAVFTLIYFTFSVLCCVFAVLYIFCLLCLSLSFCLLAKKTCITMCYNGSSLLTLIGHVKADWSSGMSAYCITGQIIH